MIFGITVNAFKDLLKDEHSNSYHSNDEGIFVLRSASYIPSMTVNLVSIMELGKAAGCKVLIIAFKATTYNEEQGSVMTFRRQQNSCMMVMISLTQEKVQKIIRKISIPASDFIASTALSVSISDKQKDILLWHRRLGQGGLLV